MVKKSLRVEEVLEEPGAENGDGALGETALGAPDLLLLEHADLLQGSLVAQALIEDSQTRSLALVQNGHT
jgi:hypothetical protein